MKKFYEHNGYCGSAEISEENLLWGKILYINDLVVYEGETPDKLATAFKAAVDDYIETCIELGREPNKPFKGSFNVRVGADIHRDSAVAADRMGESLNEFVMESLKQRLTHLRNESTISRTASGLTKLSAKIDSTNTGAGKSDTKVGDTSTSIRVGPTRPALKVVK